MKLPKKVKDIFVNEAVHQLATSSLDGIPNISNVGAKYLLDDESIVVVDNYMDKTLSNILANPRVAILVRTERESYQIKGSSTYLTEGPIYEEAKKWMGSVSKVFPAKGALLIKIEEIFHSSSGQDAGKKLV